MSDYAQSARLHIQFKNYWHSGSGKGSGYHLDALCERDADQLPILPGRQLKGLLRHAVHRAEAWGWLADIPLPAGPISSHEELLFGSRSQSESRDATLPGMLLVDTANLPDAERKWLAQPEQSSLRQELFTELFSTAINDQGSAQRYSLRGIEVCIPVMLESGLQLAITAQHSQLRNQQLSYLQALTNWDALKAALPLLDALGAHRSRGLGEAELRLVTTAKEHEHAASHL